ncbi:carbon catabolite repressor protein 4 homolog 4 isoform X4 [Vitis riparia]|uniref:carbon catabolite repressor protein 4 homolog 4 isoform X4 n=1 Tax=Vitis riparia TaxID=96939 RepID=UPI00155A0BA2|nr:carbon catabolite repressor protein 4 homolog 4 isoform X4 [Vitis riparia]
MLLKGGVFVLPRFSPSFSISSRIRLSKMSTAAAPIIPKFISVEGVDINSRSIPDGFRFSLVSYNILAQVYVKSSLFPHSPSPCLNAELVLEEKIEYNDLVDLNDDGSYSNDRHCDTPASANSDAEPKKGSSPQNTTEERGDPNDPRVRLKRDCVGIMAAFRLKDPSHHLVIVANTHLYWDPEWADVKLAQAKYLLSRLAQFKTAVSDKFECTPSVLVAGDFNSIPGDKVYQYLVSGNSSVPQLECLDGLPIPLCSVYDFTRGEPPFTNCTPDFTNTLDYIFFSPSGHIKPVSFLELPEPDSSDVAGGLPNHHHPSDHLPIGAEFKVTGE